MERFALLMTLLIVIGVPYTTTAQTPATVCPPCECDKHGNCPNPTTPCPTVHNCSAGIVKDKCGCCDVCAKSVGEACRKEPREKENEECAVGLKCMHSEDAWYCEQMEPENVRVSRCEPADTPQCYDVVTKNSYRRGEIWTRGEFACVACLCGANSQPHCWGMKCVKPGCKDPARVEERCCPFCLDSEWKMGCTFKGNKFFDNELIVLQDHRSICKCNKAEGWVCEDDNSQPFVHLNERPQCVDSLTDEVYKKGGIWSLSECAHCLCGDHNLGNCSTIQCPKPQCDEPFKIKDRCCPICPTDYSSVCHYIGEKYLQGEVIVLPDRCTLCTCDKTSWQCSSDRCRLTKMIQEPLTMRPK